MTRPSVSMDGEPRLGHIDWPADSNPRIIEPKVTADTQPLQVVLKRGNTVTSSPTP